MRQEKVDYERQGSERKRINGKEKEERECEIIEENKERRREKDDKLRRMKGRGGM